MGPDSTPDWFKAVHGRRGLLLTSTLGFHARHPRDVVFPGAVGEGVSEAHGPGCSAPHRHGVLPEQPAHSTQDRAKLCLTANLDALLGGQARSTQNPVKRRLPDPFGKLEAHPRRPVRSTQLPGKRRSAQSQQKRLSRSDTVVVAALVLHNGSAVARAIAPDGTSVSTAGFDSQIRETSIAGV